MKTVWYWAIIDRQTLHYDLTFYLIYLMSVFCFIFQYFADTIANADAKAKNVYSKDNKQNQSWLINFNIYLLFPFKINWIDIFLGSL